MKTITYEEVEKQGYNKALKELEEKIKTNPDYLVIENIYELIDKLFKGFNYEKNKKESTSQKNS